MNLQKPSGAPGCWGRLHQDGEEECRQCKFTSDCRTETLYQLNRPGTKVPVFGGSPQTVLPPPARTLPAPAPIIPLPPKPSYIPPVTQYQSPTVKPATPVITAPVTQSAPTPVLSYQSPTSYSLPDLHTPNPITPWYRPGAPGPAYHFTQYPGEGVGIRLIKNAILRALEVIFGELMQFFRHWTWPSSR